MSESISESAFVDSNTVLAFRIGRSPGLWPEITGHYKPATPDDAQDFFQSPKPTGGETVRLHAKLLVKHLIDWTLTGKDGQPVPLTESSLAKLHHAIRTSLVNHVLGYAAGQLEADLKN